MESSAACSFTPSPAPSAASVHLLWSINGKLHSVSLAQKSCQLLEVARHKQLQHHLAHISTLCYSYGFISTLSVLLLQVLLCVCMSCFASDGVCCIRPGALVLGCSLIGSLPVVPSCARGTCASARPGRWARCCGRRLHTSPEGRYNCLPAVLFAAVCMGLCPGILCNDVTGR
jgi:hypothetical protein